MFRLSLRETSPLLTKLSFVYSHALTVAPNACEVIVYFVVLHQQDIERDISGMFSTSITYLVQSTSCKFIMSKHVSRVLSLLWSILILVWIVMFRFVYILESSYFSH